MSSRILVGAVVAALSVWGGAWMLAGQRKEPAALAAPVRAETRHQVPSVTLDIPHAARASVLEPEALAPAESVADSPFSPRELARLVTDLRDDDIRHNAQNAVE